MSGMPTAVMAHPSAELYGSDRMFAESVRALAGAGWRTVAVLPHSGPLVDELRQRGAQVEFCPTPVLAKAALRPAGLIRLAAQAIRALPAMLRVLRRHRPDLVFVNTVTIPLWLVLARGLGHRVVVHVHEAEDAAPRPIRMVLAAPLLAARIVVVNSRAALGTLERSLHRVGRKARLVYNGVIGPCAPVDRPLRVLPERLVLVGRLSPRKGTDIAIEAVKRLHAAGHEVTLDLIGSVCDGYEWFERALIDQIDAAGLAGHVRLAGFTADVWAAYADADIALVPSRVEPFGNVAVEAQLAGVPVIVSDAQGLPETVDGGRFGTVVPAEDPGALADAVVAMREDWARVQRTAAAAQEAAREKFSPERYRAVIADVVSEAVAARRRVPV